MTDGRDTPVLEGLKMAILNFARRAAPQPADAGLEAFMQGYSIEVMPRTAEKVDDFRALLPEGTRVYIAHIDGTPIEDMVATARRLAADGFEVMPHFPARIIRDRATLADWITLSVAAGGSDDLGVIFPPANQAADFELRTILNELIVRPQVSSGLAGITVDQPGLGHPCLFLRGNADGRGLIEFSASNDPNSDRVSHIYSSSFTNNFHIEHDDGTIVLKADRVDLENPNCTLTRGTEAQGFRFLAQGRWVIHQIGRNAPVPRRHPREKISLAQVDFVHFVSF